MHKSKQSTKSPTAGERRPKAERKLKSPTQPTSKARRRPSGVQAAVRENSKLATVVALLRAPKGATIEELSKATGWQTHSVRGAISGAIKRKLALTVTSVKTDGIRTYHISS